MINLVSKQNAMPEQTPDVRNKNFLEVCTGYTEDMAIREAMRCLRCRKKPCVSGCPVNIKIPDFIAKVAEGDFEAAYEIISQDSSKCDFKVLTTVTLPAENPTPEDYTINATAVFEDGSWKLTSMLY